MCPQNLRRQARAARHFQCRGTGWNAKGGHSNVCLFLLQHSLLLCSVHRESPGGQRGIRFRPQFLLRPTQPVQIHSMSIIFPQCTRTNAQICSILKPNLSLRCFRVQSRIKNDIGHNYTMLAYTKAIFRQFAVYLDAQKNV